MHLLFSDSLFKNTSHYGCKKDLKSNHQYFLGVIQPPCLSSPQSSFSIFLFNKEIPKAIAVTLKNHPVVNASYTADAISYNSEINVAVAVAMPDLQEKLSKDIADISWQELLPHAKRDAIIIVEPGLDLSEVAVAIAQDNTASVQNWIANKSIAKPTADRLSQWNDNPQTQFIALIVQPFVVVQESH
ncbi:DUF2288 family protein [Waterburya agarophytonicola K14]|uniref:DUF2288 family protein n=1 Tax=Waterburya agarophytonicola KI4 TaxID=2874699 RepID=A0A964BSZ2_9CYAN|nr:DUF2288 domain-containing protein [Waterburya agarophytonicola]MCC0178266.1 DUF2288 family protein [Waterburya agarophytonicola KI4]